VAFHRGIDGSDPVRGERIGRLHEEHRLARSRLLATGTLACPRCDAPVSPGSQSLSPAEPLGCPFCGHGAAVRDFLSLATPTRPARVEIRLRMR
jgi:hypothetical protein